VDVVVEYLGQVRMITNRKDEVVVVPPDAAIKDLLDVLSKRYGELFDAEVFQEGQIPRDDLVIAVNGIAIRQINNLETGLKHNDTVTLFPIFPGGG
jgi:MoaD family protein